MINELRPVLGLELTATPQIEKGSKLAEPFQNVIYSYPLSEALKDGFVKDPAVATRENFDKSNYTEAGLERLKLEDGIHVHEETKMQLELYARETGTRPVKPFMLVVAEDTQHAEQLKATIEHDDFFGGQYKVRVIDVHSQKSGVEKDENVQLLLSIDIPRINVVPRGVAKAGYQDFDLNCKAIRPQPVSQEILIHPLASHEQFRLRSGDGVVPEKSLEDYLVRGLMDYDDINYDDHAELLYKLAGQMVARRRRNST